MTTEGGRLARLGFVDVEAARRRLEAVAGSDVPVDDLATAVGGAADPDLAADGLARLAQALPRGELSRFRAALTSPDGTCERLVAVLGASAASSVAAARSASSPATSSTDTAPDRSRAAIDSSRRR